MLKKLVKKVLRSILNLEIRRVSGQSKHRNTGPLFDCLQRIKFRPVHIIDIGANHGAWTRAALRYFPAAHFSMFEPQSNLAVSVQDLLNNPNIKLYNLGVGPSSGMMKLTTHEHHHSFSFSLTEDEASTFGRKQIDAPVVSLDEFLLEQELAFPDIIKIDAEGWDLEVIKGAERAVQNASVVLLEAAVMNKHFRNRIELVISEMKTRGFVVFDITDLIRTKSTNALWLVEIAFVKVGGDLDKSVAFYSK